MVHAQDPVQSAAGPATLERLSSPQLDNLVAPCHGSGYDAEGINFLSYVYSRPKGERSQFGDPGAILRLRECVAHVQTGSSREADWLPHKFSENTRIRVCR